MAPDQTERRSPSKSQGVRTVDRWGDVPRVAVAFPSWLRGRGGNNVRGGTGREG